MGRPFRLPAGAAWLSRGVSADAWYHRNSLAPKERHRCEFSSSETFSAGPAAPSCTSACRSCRSSTPSISPIANGENAAGGFGITPQIAEELFELGIDVITTGNHVWDKREIIDYMNSANGNEASLARRVIRPANYPAGTPGFGWYQGRTRGGVAYAVINLQGRVFMTNNDDPFRMADELLKQITAKVILVDFHAEATSEKVALGWYLEGRVTAVLGTHTHVPTADEQRAARGHRGPDRRRHDRPVRRRHRRAEGTDPAALPDQHAVAL